MEKKKRFTFLMGLSLALGVAALVLILISIFGNFKTNWVLIAGLACVCLGSIISFVSIRREKKKERDS